MQRGPLLQFIATRPVPRIHAGIMRGGASRRSGCSLIDQIASIAVGTREAQKENILGRVYEYLLGKFAAAEARLGRDFYA
jgi:hypothetical protein